MTSWRTVALEHPLNFELFISAERPEPFAERDVWTDIFDAVASQLSP
ncbi:MAG TPA: hypothetical protein VKS22_14845 [Candidatus Binataceae bacterium]|nr:hypothetical protein [Candidatus Binataceae bacterium]